MPVDMKATQRSVKQIIDKNGMPLKASLASNIWVVNNRVFSQPQAGNKIEPFITSEDYFTDLVKAMRAAEKEICILGWQVNWDAMLAPKLRLYDVILEIAKKKKVKIFVMPWDDTKPMLTYDMQTKTVLESINSHPDVNSKQVEVLLCRSLASKNKAYFSQHQKQVIVDRKIAYIGGVDLAYGRFEDATFDLIANSRHRQVLNRYNPCIPQLQRLKTDLLVDPDLMTGVEDSYVPNFKNLKTSEQLQKDKIASGGWQIPYLLPGLANILQNSTIKYQRLEGNVESAYTLDPARQPRMPWQDVHSRIEGPSVSDLMRNFVVRWNGLGGSRLQMPSAPSTYEKPGNANIQVLRSAPQSMRASEQTTLNQTNKTGFVSGPENDIHSAMVQLIEKSSRFIYIESQFFVSGFGTQARTALPTLSPAANLSTGQREEIKTKPQRQFQCWTKIIKYW